MEQIELKSMDEQQITISAGGKIDSTNAEKCNSRIQEILSNQFEKKIFIDLENLEYISSAGLRMFLRCAKQAKQKISLINVSASVYEILDLTGFCDFFEVQKELRKLSIDGCGILGRGANGVVYKIGDEIVKVYNEGTPFEVVEKERRISKQALLAGITTAIPYDVVKIGNCYGVVFELLNAQSLSAVFSARPEDYDKFAKQYIDTFIEIHSIEANEEDFDSMKDIFLGNIAACSDYYENEELDKLRALVNAIPDQRTLLHGDYHANNIMVIDDELYLIDVGDMSYGHPIFDFIATGATQSFFVSLQPEFIEKHHTYMPVDIINRLWKELVDSCYKEKTTEELEEVYKFFYRLSILKVALGPVVSRDVPKEIIDFDIMITRKELLPYVDELIEQLKDYSDLSC